MKKLIAILLVLALLTGVLTACGADVPSGEVTPLPESTEAPTEEPTEAPTEEPTEAPTEAPAEAEENAFSLGSLEGGIYTNTYAGFGCQLDSTWTYKSAEELQELPEAITDALNDTIGEDLLAQHPTITDMMAENADTLANINVGYTYLTVAARVAYAMMSDEELVDMTLGSSKDIMLASYEAIGLEDITIEKTTATFLGEERVALKTHGLISGMDYYILQVFDYSLGAYGVTITASSILEDSTQDLLNLFYAVE